MLCLWCEEEIAPGQECGHLAGAHHECATRMVVGSLGHQLKMCSCYGGSLDDPPGLTRRQAAMMAMRIAQIHKGGGHPSRGEPRCQSAGRTPIDLVKDMVERFPDLAEQHADVSSITCPKCGRTSFNPNDKQNGYCSACHEYHDTMNLPSDRS